MYDNKVNRNKIVYKIKKNKTFFFIYEKRRSRYLAKFTK